MCSSVQVRIEVKSGSQLCTYFNKTLNEPTDSCKPLLFMCVVKKSKGTYDFVFVWL